MRICSVFLLIVHTACAAMISIHVQHTLIELGSMNIDIRCLINDSEIESVIVIQLSRSNAPIVSVRKAGVSWQDEELQHRAFADGSVINATSSYLHMTIDRQNVTKNDSGEYFCTSSAQDKSKEYIAGQTPKTFLSITETKEKDTNETKEKDTNDTCGYKPSHRSFLLVLVAALINYIAM
uniref:Uncharacterized protein LOC111106900 isoform X2 n=1 Tax=Crassostrea virginica TaxID=6565 RepID=A0A8B8B253_CRAVI|nr:uncharacterized protein LOC111106900 isoform X2 [Crassostrea virginica]